MLHCRDSIYSCGHFLWFKTEMPPKKRKLTFDLDDVEKRSEEMQRAILELYRALENCHVSKSLNFLDPEEFLNFATIKYGYRFVQDLLLVLSAVSEESGPWRAEITRKLLMNSRGKISLGNDKESIINLFCNVPCSKVTYINKPNVTAKCFPNVYTTTPLQAVPL